MLKRRDLKKEIGQQRNNDLKRDYLHVNQIKDRKKFE
jgi:hypothetical protein